MKKGFSIYLIFLLQNVLLGEDAVPPVITDIDPLKISYNLSVENATIGQPLLLTITLKSNIPFYKINALSVKLPFLEDGNFKIQERDLKKSLNSNKAVGIPVGGRRLIGRWLNDKTIETNFILIPQATGLLSLKTITANYSVDPKNKTRKQYQYPAYYNNQFFKQVGTGNKYTAHSTEQHIAVKTIPAGTVPNNFNNSYYPFKITTIAKPLSVEVGQPITLTITLSDYPFLENIQLPALSIFSEFNQLFTIPPNRSDKELHDQSITYRQTIRPRSIKTTTIPAITLNYFDPTLNQFVEISSEEISISVKPGSHLTANEVQLSSGQTLLNKVRRSKNGIHHNFKISLDKHPAFKSGELRILIFTLTPIFAFIAFYYLTYFNRLQLFHPLIARSVKAKETAFDELSTIENENRNLRESHRKALIILQLYLVKKLEKDEPLIPWSDLLIAINHRTNEPNLTSRIKTIILNCESVGYTNLDNSTNTLDSNISKIKEIIASVDNRIGSSKI